MKCLLLILSLLVSIEAVGQETFSDRIKGLRIRGMLQAGFPVVIQDSTTITIEFDSNDDQPVNFILKWYHCDRNWVRTSTSFINDEARNLTRTPLYYRAAPVGVRHYRWHYAVVLPGIPELRTFAHSGNYQFELWDEHNEQMLARGRFFVAERTVKPTVRVANRQLPSLEHPWNKSHRVEVQVVLPERLTRHAEPENGFLSSQNRDEILLPLFLNAVDIYKNRELTRPYRIDANRPSPTTFVLGFGTHRVRFVHDHVQPGNEYRVLDLRNVDEYPPGQQLRSKTGADVSRMLFRSTRDQNGMANLVQGSRYADYLSFQFELVDNARDGRDSVFVVGEFNGWMVSPSSLMHYDDAMRRFIKPTMLRRGAYDYQYVLLKNGVQDWITLEGNDWRTVNVYTTLVYYRDERYGGFDRILGVVQGQSSGMNEATQ
jgi:hypothetical protein